ncbi:MAG: sigma-70 family RNA polymerase sigma factor [Tidjanibacter sp.]|nr:sigma-70 family RNA polymerase sigma factor [Tidjanibacter sp.]
MNQREFSEKLLPMKQLIFRYALGLVGSREEAEDITQDVYAKLWERCEELDMVSNLQGYVLGTTRNLALDRIKRRRRFDQRVEVMRHEERVSRQPDGFDIKELLAQVVATLPDKQQTIFHLRDVEGKEMTDIAATVGVDEPTVRVLLSRARKTIREEMQKIMNYGV